MPNAVKGEVAFLVGEGQAARSFTLKLGHNARAEAESVLNRPWREIAAELMDEVALSYGTARAVLWAALRRFHPELSLLDVGDLMDETGDEYVGVKIGEALIAAAPKGSDARPPQAEPPQVGTNN